jgi:hypothetical protein
MMVSEAVPAVRQMVEAMVLILVVMDDGLTG